MRMTLSVIPNVSRTLRALLIATMLVAVLFSIAPAFAGRDDFPRMDQLQSIICANEGITVSKAQNHDIDAAFSVTNTSDIATLQGLGWKISAVLGYGFHCIGINCRDYAPSYVVPSYDYHGRRAGNPLFPLNVSAFRFALHLIIGGEVKQTIIAQVFGWTSVAIDTIPTPAAGSAWTNTAITSVHDEPQALALLNSVGFYNDTAHTGLANGVWANTNSSIGPTGEIRAGPGFAGTFFDRTIACMGCPEAATSTSLVTAMFMAEWNRFFGLNSAGNPYFVYDSLAWTDMLQVATWDHDADVWGAGWAVGKDPDYLYDFFDSAGDVYGGSNMEGIHNAALDVLVEELKFTAWPNGTIITDMATLQSICKAAQYDIYYLAPCIINRADITANLFAYDVAGMNKVHDWIEPLGYTAQTGWTYDWVTVDNTNVLRTCNPGTADTLNPLTAGSIYDHNIIDRLYDGFLAVDPFTKADVDWCVSSHSVVEWNDSGINAHGLNMTFKLRYPITWHNGDPFNASDAVWSLNFICNVKPSRYSDLWTYMYQATAIDDCTVNVLFNNTGLWFLYEVAGDAMMFNRKVWQPWWDSKAGAESWTPWTVNYDSWTGESGHGGLTCMVGTGSWVFVVYDGYAGYAKLMANRPFTTTDKDGNTWTYTGRYWAGSFVREDVNFDFRVDKFDYDLVQYAFGAVPGSPRWEYGRYDVVQSWKVDLSDLHSVQAKAVLHDVAVTNVMPSKTVIGQGYNVNVNVTVQNPGSYTESFNTTVYANATVITSLTNITLTNATSTTFDFTWNTAFCSKGNYTVRANATLRGEMNTMNNNFTNGVVHVGVPGNVNYFDASSRIVDMIDMWLVQKYYGAVKGQPGPLYVPNCDIDDNGKIDMIDLWIAQKNYGQTEP